MTWKQEIYYRVLEMADNSCNCILYLNILLYELLDHLN